MARLPTAADLGARPTPQAYAGRPSTVPNAGGVAQAAGQLGETAFRIGQGIVEKEDKLNYAAAKTALLKADITARAELENEPDHAKYESLYAARMKTAREAAGKMITSRSDRSLFDADADLDFARGQAEVMKVVRGKRIAVDTATLESGLDALQDTALSANDEGTRAQAIMTASEMIDGGVAKGVMDAAQAGRLKRTWASNYAGAQISNAIMREDLVTAKRTYEANADKLDLGTALNLAGDIKRMEDKRQSATDAMGSAPGFAPSVNGQPAGRGDFGVIIGLEGGTGPKGEFLTSPKGAVGPAQVMPGTAPDAAKLAGLPWDEKLYRSDPAYNNALGEAYFKDMLRQFGDPSKAAAAYNAGPGNASKGTGLRGAMEKAKKAGQPDNWEAYLPDETQKYVKNFRKRSGYGAADQGAARWDKEAWYSNIDARADQEGWSFERRERAKDYANQQIGRDEQLLARREDDADRQASEFILDRREGFTDVSQIPRNIWSNMSVSARSSAMNAAEENGKKEPESNGPLMWQAHAIMYGEPERFKAMDLSQYVGKVSRAEMDSLVSEQMKMRSGGETTIRSNISGTIDFFSKLDKQLAETLDPKKQPEAYSRVFQDMQAYVIGITKGQRDPTDAEAKAAFDRATMKVIVQTPGMIWGSKREEVRRFEVDPGQDYRVQAGQVGQVIPSAVRQRIVGSLRRIGNGSPSEADISKAYLAGRGQPGLW